MAKAGSNWTKEQDELLRKYFHTKSREQLMDIFGRSWEGIRTRYYTKIHIRSVETKVVDMTRCKNCGSKNVNQIPPNSRNVYYCKDCLLEYNRRGVMQPIWE